MCLLVHSVAGCEERSPEPKPRWNPKPEQIRILEAIFNSGMVNPPRDEIRKIRAQLQEYGQVGDANVFYWFQNRKSRSKHKLRHLQGSKQHSQQVPQTHQTPSTTPTASVPAAATAVGPSSSSSSSDKSSPKAPFSSVGFSNVAHDVSNSPTASVNNQTFFQSHNDFLAEPFFFPVHHHQSGGSSTEFCFSDLSNVGVQNVGPCTSLLLSEIMNQGATKRDHHDDEEAEKVLKMETQHLNYDATTTTPPPSHTVSPHNIAASNTIAVPSVFNHIQGKRS